MKRASTGKTSPAKASTVTGRTDWARVRALKDKDIQHDADSPCTTAADWDGAVMKQGGASIGTVRRRGPNKIPAKVSTTLRLPADTLARWKATGPGWQTRMAEALTKVLL
jgi:uncharacterized protein (DUF4415 family)